LNVDANSIINDVIAVTKKWTKQRKAEVRQAKAVNRREYMFSARNTATEIAGTAIPKGYQKASNNGTLPAHARQIMYACRNEIQEHTGQPLSDVYFTQKLLPDFMSRNRALTASWDVIFDARGRFAEPHTGREVPLGTLQVRQYLRGGTKKPDSPVAVRGLFPTHGPGHRFGAVLFIEKEGFLPLLHRVHLAQRYDLAIMSTKGMSVVAARALVDELCGRHGVPLLVAHDFDKAGFSILATLTGSNHRYSFCHRVKPVDLGLRLKDVMGLEDEDSFLSGDKVKHRRTLQRNGASEEEISFLVDQRRRVELNVFDSRAFVDWLEGKLKQHGVKKVVPAPEVLEKAYRRAYVLESVQKAARHARKWAERRAAALAAPADLPERVAALLKESPQLPWDRALAEIVKTRLAERGDSARETGPPRRSG
jgi:hypothetical protein